MAFVIDVKAQTIDTNTLEKELSNLESIYNISPNNNDIISRLNTLDLKAIGLINKGTEQQRIEILNTNHQTQIKLCSTPAIKPDNTPLIKEPVKNPINPLKYTYKTDYGNYFDITKASITKQGNDPKDYHFKKFPITYSIESSEPEFTKIIKLSLEVYNEFIPIKEVKSSSNPDITINVVGKETMAFITGDENKFGLNRTGTKSQNGLVVEFKSEVFLNKKIFKYPMSIYASSTINHEFLHALGMTGHSKSPYDLLYPQIDVNILYGAQVGLIKETCQIKDFNQFAKLSQRDLNTLWLLYNEW